MFTITALHEMFPFTQTQKDSSYKMKQNFLCSSLASNEQIQLAHKGSTSAASGAQTTTNMPYKRVFVSGYSLGSLPLFSH